MKKINIQKIILVLIPVLFIFSGISKADTFQFSYDDPNVCTPAPAQGNTCPSPNAYVLATIAISPAYNTNNLSISAYMPENYQICSSNTSGGSWSCYDGLSTNVYGGNSRLGFTTYDSSGLANTDVFKLVGQTDGKTYYVKGCPTGCWNPYIYMSSGSGVTWPSGSMTPSSLPKIDQTYTLSMTDTPTLFSSVNSGYSSSGGSWVLQPFTVSSNIFIPAPPACTNSSPAPQTATTIACGNTTYFQIQGDTTNTQYKTGSTYNGNVVSSYSCSPDATYGSPATVTINFASTNSCSGPSIFVK